MQSCTRVVTCPHWANFVSHTPTGSGTPSRLVHYRHFRCMRYRHSYYETIWYRKIWDCREGRERNSKEGSYPTQKAFFRYFIFGNYCSTKSRRRHAFWWCKSLVWAPSFAEEACIIPQFNSKFFQICVILQPSNMDINTWGKFWKPEFSEVLLLSYNCLNYL